MIYFACIMIQILPYYVMAPLKMYQIPITVEHYLVFSLNNLLLTLVLLNKLRCQDFCYKFTYIMANSADPDQLASSEAN